jgi:hypothetical protein
MSERRDERTIGAEQIREEHLAQVHEGVQWAYLLGVLLLGTLGMLLLIALLDAS